MKMFRNMAAGVAAFIIASALLGLAGMSCRESQRQDAEHEQNRHEECLEMIRARYTIGDPSPCVRRKP